MTTRALALLTTAVLAAVGPGARAGQGSGSIEVPIKAAFLYRFGGFVGWPPGAFAGPRAPLVLCVVGRDPFGVQLDDAVRGRTTAERAIEVRRTATLEAGSGCHVAYLGGGGPRQSVSEALAAAAGQPVLTVTDEDTGPTRGAVHFVTTGGRVRFHIDERRAAQGGVSISSKLLNLALSVRTGR